jgi:hypothetical protein
VLAAGQNEVTLAGEAGETDVSLVDRLGLRYFRTYTARNDTVRFTARGGQTVTVRGFTDSDLRVLDVTAPDAARELLGTVAADGEGYAVHLGISHRGTRELYAFTADRTREPAAIELNSASNWRGEAKAADIAIITAASFAESLEPLVALREQQGYTVDVVAVEDLYDEFAFGAKDPGAIKQYLAGFAVPPRFVLLAGDASLDPRDYLGRGDLDLVPTHHIETTFLETASDDWFVDFDDDGLPEIPIGRLPARTNEEAATLAAKIVDYEEAAADAWARQALIIADHDDAFGFADMVAAIKDLFPASENVQVLSLGDLDPASASAELFERLNAGVGLVAYCGHGSVERWSASGMLTSASARTLANARRLPFVIAMTCLNAYFDDVYSESLAEALVRAEGGGAAAVWASSGLTRPEVQTLLNAALLRALFDGTNRRIGEAILEAKAAVADDDARTWVLIGDPATSLR